jgi:hypothetical protein
MFSRKTLTKNRRRPQSFSGSSIPWYGDSLKTQMRLRRREELYHLPH